MTADLNTSLSLAMPELILAVGAMVLLMVGVFFAEERRTGLVHVLAVLLLAAAALLGHLRRRGRRGLRRRLHCRSASPRFMKVLSLVGSAVTLIMSVRFARSEQLRQVRVPGPDRACDARHDADGLGQQHDALYIGLELQSLALYVLAAINRDNRALDGSRAEIFRARRAVLGHAALRHLADLRLHRQHRLRRDRDRAWRSGAPDRPGLRSRLRARRPRLQDLRRAVPHVDARCL